MPTAYVNIGSNIGNRRSMLERAVACIMRRWKGVRVSSIVESEPWGYDSSNMFLNQGVAFECSEGDTSVSVHNELQHIQMRYALPLTALLKGDMQTVRLILTL